MNWRAMRAIVRKDLKVVRQSKSVIMPLVIVPLLMLVLLPAIFGVAMTQAKMSESDLAETENLLEKFPQSLQDQFAQFDRMQDKMLYMGLVYIFAPLFLIVPLMTANVIAADSFAGEKERKTLEAVIYSPTTDTELYLAKVIPPWVSALAITFLSFVIYAVVVNIVAWPVMERVFFPTTMWVVLVLWVAPAAAGLGLGAMVLVSSRVSTFQEAYQLGGSVVLPVLMLLFGQVGGLLYFSVGVVLLVGLILWIITTIMLWYGAKTFQRGRLLSQL